jgi:hypothetical protein
MSAGVPSTNPIPLSYQEGPIRRVRNGQNPTDLGGTNYVQIQAANPVNTTTNKSSVLYTLINTNTPLTGNQAPWNVPNGPGSPLIQANALGYSGNWNVQSVGFPGTVARGKLFGVYGATGTPTIAIEVGLILNGTTPTYTALAASTALTLGAVSAQPWELDFNIINPQFITSTATPGSGFAGTVNVTSGAITSVTITNGGTGYVGIPTFASSGSSGAILIPTIVNGSIVDIRVVAGGTGATQGNAITATAVGGQLYAQGFLKLGGAAGAAATVLGLAPTTTSIDTTQPYYIDVRATFSVSSASNTITAQGGYIEFLN